MARYAKTITVKSERELFTLQAGQWFQFGKCGIKGQYLGKDKKGTPVVRMGKFSRGNAVRNRLQRSLAK